MATSKDPRKAEVKQLIMEFNHLIAQKGHLVDFFPLIEHDLLIIQPEIEFQGLAGLEDYLRCREQYFDESYKVLSWSCAEDDEGRVLVNSMIQWQASYRDEGCPVHDELELVIKHHWIMVADSDTNKLSIAAQQVESMEVVRGDFVDLIV